VIEKAALKYGLTLSTARWIEELAKELGVKERRLLKTIVKLAKHGIWLEAEDWRLAARTSTCGISTWQWTTSSAVWPPAPPPPRR